MFLIDGKDPANFSEHLDQAVSVLAENQVNVVCTVKCRLIKRFQILVFVK